MTEPTSKSGEPIRILIADDDRVIAEVYRDIIAEEGRLVDVCYDGTSAIDAMRESRYDLIVADLVMPDIGGIDLLKFAKKLYPDVVVIIITGYASLETAIAAIKEGAYDYITKPSKLEEVKIAVNNAVEKSRLNKMNQELAAKLQKIRSEYRRLLSMQKKTEAVGTDERINFFPDPMSGLHYILSRSSRRRSDLADKIEALSLLKENGVFTEEEFEALKKRLIESAAS